MTIDLRQYIISVLHIEQKINLEEIQRGAVDLLFSEFAAHPSKVNAEEICRLYSELTSVSKNGKVRDSIHPDEDKLRLEEPVSEISIDPPIVKEEDKKEVIQPKNIPGKSILLPNAKVNEPYETIIPLQENGLAGIILISITGLDEVGLQADKDGMKISGIPQMSGEFSFVMEYKHREETENRPSLFRKLAIYINPDPRSLWIELEPDPESLFPKSHTAHSELQYHGKSVIGASKRGRSHAKDAKFRDDHYELRVDPASDWLAITVSDGAGGSKYSREGSKIFCQTFLAEVFSDENRKYLDAAFQLIETGDFESNKQEIKNHLYYLIGNPLVKSFKEVEETSKLYSAAVKDFSCTFLVSLVKKIHDSWIIIGFWVGDGGIGIYFEDKEPIILGNPDSGEFSGQTRFITMPEILNNSEEIFGRIKLARVADFKGLALMTDGISDAWFHTDSNLFKKEKWDELWLEIHKNLTDQTGINSIELLEWLDFWVKGEYDDRTIVILN
jgi:hypothetical protein